MISDVQMCKFLMCFAQKKSFSKVSNVGKALYATCEMLAECIPLLRGAGVCKTQQRFKSLRNQKHPFNCKLPSAHQKSAHQQSIRLPDAKVHYRQADHDKHMRNVIVIEVITNESFSPLYILVCNRRAFPKF